MRFQEILGLDDGDVRPLQRGYAAEYPQVATDHAHEMAPAVDALKPMGKVRRTYRFASADDAWTVVLTPTSLSLETTAYDDFRGFVERWRHVAALAVDELDILRQERLGLRYANELACSPEPTREDLRRLVREELVGIIGAHDPRTMHPWMSIQEARFFQEDGICTFRHGLTSAGEGIRLYLLDFDYYDDDERELNLDFQLRQLAAFNHGIYQLFKWSIAPDRFESFEPHERKAGRT